MRRVLIANRGEIALRIIRACRDLGLETVVVHSTQDRDTRPVRMADAAVCIGPPEPARSYLYTPAVVEAALASRADAMHPGYGFLSEDADLAAVCRENGLTFVGPSAEAMARVADKAETRALMTEAGLPLLPGTTAAVQSEAEAFAVAEEIGFPLILKATAGGGGRGMTVVRGREHLAKAFRETRTQAKLAFNDGSLYIERYLEGARHIEVQILCDAHGNGVHLGERDCSVQRRHQKVLEEAPSPALTPAMRDDVGALAVRGALAVGYQGAGTMEFLLDAEGRFWFMEMNARIQVEHPVTEMVTGIDLVAAQLRVAAGERLWFGQEDVKVTGHAIECRINAEEPRSGFAPRTGTVTDLALPAGPWIRVDSHLEAGTHVSPHYDALLAKVVAWGADREESARRMRRALAELRVEGRGLATTRDLHEAVLGDAEFLDGGVTLDYLGRRLDDLVATD
ncbi:acetyl-CoA carboxylase biotin carboxylase subunit [Sinomonas mesophila]|uniref:acetyl-CoA carboxylase biotin carboxylase subunit n=1 Tax=Sinomonas mesophila TaxID=1531955 RepID=UPI000985C09F|nr:acetyl-CoA carboxylase biotin carboxylase subunit [Sinomonas mesophila]